MSADTDPIIHVFSQNRLSEAEDYAGQIGGYVTHAYNEYGAVAVRLADAEGKYVPRWSGHDVPEGFLLTRRDQVRKGDEVVSSHYGRREVVDVLTQGITTQISIRHAMGPESERYDSDSLIPVLRPVEVDHEEVYNVSTSRGFTETFDARTIQTLLSLGLIRHERDGHHLQDGDGNGVGPVVHFYVGTGA